MKITTEEAQKIALLSRLSFADEDLEKMRDSMNSILTYMDLQRKRQKQRKRRAISLPSFQMAATDVL